MPESVVLSNLATVGAPAASRFCVILRDRQGQREGGAVTKRSDGNGGYYMRQNPSLHASSALLIHFSHCACAGLCAQV